MSNEIQMSLSMIEDINRSVKEDDYDLSDFESRFIASISKQLAAGTPLEDKDDKILDRIWKESKGEA